MSSSADILIIDDDRELVASMKTILESRGFQVRTAHDGKQGYHRILEKAPDLILLDVMMNTHTEGCDLPAASKRMPASGEFP